MLSTLKFGTNGIRGIYGSNITPEFMLKLGRSIAHAYPLTTAIIGHDGRNTSVTLKNALSSGLLAEGVNVIDVGFIPTPGLQYLTKEWHVDVGVMITASHNPPEYNGVKIMYRDGIELDSSLEQAVIREYSSPHNNKDWKKIGQYSISHSAIQTYLQGILRHVDVPLIQKQKFTVTFDGSNSVGSLVTPTLLSRLNARVISLNAHLDGHFPGRLPEPTPEHLSVLSTLTSDLHADFGVAHDGDADRAVFCKSDGSILYGDRTVAIIAKWWFEHGDDKRIVTPISSSSLLEDLANEYDAEIIWTKVGSIHVSRTMQKMNVKLGGEENGGVFFGPHLPVRDGAMAVALLAHIMATRGSSLSELDEELPSYYQHKTKYACPHNLKHMVLNDIKNTYSDHEIITLDGLKILKSEGWILIRPSGTEPLIRCFIEAKSPSSLSQYEKEAKSIITSVLKKYEIDSNS